MDVRGDNPFTDALRAYAAAVRTKNVEAFLAIYDEDISVFDSWDRWSLRGVEQWRAMVTGWFGSLGDDHIVVDVDEPEATVLGNLAVGHALLMYTARSPDETVLRSLDNRVTLALRRNRDKWKVFHEHTSMPIGSETLKAIMSRAPRQSNHE